MFSHRFPRIVDEFTGRVMEGRRWSNGLHQARQNDGKNWWDIFGIEAKLLRADIYIFKGYIQGYPQNNITLLCGLKKIVGAVRGGWTSAHWNFCPETWGLLWSNLTKIFQMGWFSPAVRKKEAILRVGRLISGMQILEEHILIYLFSRDLFFPWWESFFGPLEWAFSGSCGWKVFQVRENFTNE